MTWPEAFVALAEMHGLPFYPSHSDWEVCLMGCSRGIPS